MGDLLSSAYQPRTLPDSSPAAVATGMGASQSAPFAISSSSTSLSVSSSTSSSSAGLRSGSHAASNGVGGGGMANGGGEGVTGSADVADSFGRFGVCEAAALKSRRAYPVHQNRPQVWAILGEAALLVQLCHSIAKPPSNSKAREGHNCARRDRRSAEYRSRAGDLAAAPPRIYCTDTEISCAPQARVHRDV